MKILVLGGNGFIGQSVCQKLAAEGHSVTAYGRNIAEASQRLKNVIWHSIDIGTLTSANSWQAPIAGMDVIVNCAGALQDSSRDDVVTVQQDAMFALYKAAELSNLSLIVQISAAVKGNGANLPFIATKRAADEILGQSKIPHVILRPALVIGRNAHGGTALLRSLASFPRITPLIYADQPIQTVTLDDVARAVSACLEGRILPGSDVSLAASHVHTLADAVAAHRSWLGLPPANLVRIPQLLASVAAWMADCTGFLGWRSPLRSTAITIMSNSVISVSPPTEYLPQLLTLEQTLAANPAGAQDLWFARLYLLKPLVILTLSLFWIASGALTLWSLDAATMHLAAHLGQAGAASVTIATSIADILLGGLVLFRRHAAGAMLGMLSLSIVYLVGGTLLEPSLWLDPLGSYVKIFPSLLLTLIGLSILNER